jgi:DNA-binding transcriptional ArsR family regulator
MPKEETANKESKNEEPTRADLHLATILDALGDDVRLNIVRQLAKNGEKACGTFGIEVPKSTLSHHFRVLRMAGVLSVRREGKELINAIRREDLDVRFPGLLASVVSTKAASRAPKRSNAR